MPKPNTIDDWIDDLLDTYRRDINKHINSNLARIDEVDLAGEAAKVAAAKAKALITAKLKEVDRAARIDTSNIQDWTNRGLESAKPEVWFRCLQLINNELASLKGGDV